MTAESFAEHDGVTDQMADAAQLAYYDSVSGPDDPAVIKLVRSGHARHHWRAALEAALAVSSGVSDQEGNTK